MNKAQAMVELHKVQPKYARALSGLNPPDRTEDRAKREAAQVAFWSVIILGVASILLIAHFTDTWLLGWFIASAFVLLVARVGNKIADKFAPHVPEDTLYTMQRGYEEISRTDSTILLEYFAPTGSQPFHDILSSELSRVLHKYPDADEDTLEYLVVPVFGQAVYEAQIPVFRYSIRIQSIPTPTVAELGDDIDVGEII